MVMQLKFLKMKKGTYTYLWSSWKWSTTKDGTKKIECMFVCLFVFEIKIREQCELQTRMKKKNIYEFIFFKWEKKP